MKIQFMLLILLTSFTSAQKRSFTIEDLYRIQGISDPQISPDGRKIAFTVTRYHMKEGTQNADIWMMNADGSDLKQITRGDKSESHPRWSPDGCQLMFLSNRKEGTQIWLLPVAGGEPEQLTSIATGISDPVWTPESQSILFESKVFPEYGANDSLNRRDIDSLKNGPLKAHMADALLYRHWTSWDDGRKAHTLIIHVKTGEIQDLTPGIYHAPRFSLGDRGYAVSPDSREFCVVSNHDPDPWSSTNADLWTGSLNGGDLVNITDDNEAYDGDPLYSPDGRFIAYRKQIIPRYEADRFRLALYDRKSGKHRILTEMFDNWIEDFRWMPDSKSLIFKATVKGHQPLYTVNIENGRIQLLMDVHTINNFEIAPDGRWLTLTRRSIGEPTSIYRAGSSGKQLKRLETINASFEAEVDIRPAEELWIEGAEGHPMQVYLIKPHQFDPDKRYPVIINVHGGPQSLWLDAFRGDWQVYPGAGYVLALPNPHGSTGYGQAYTEAISKDWGGKVFDDILRVSDAVAQLPYVDAERMGAMGWSYGGYMMMWLEGHTDRFKAIASMMGVYDLKSKFGATEELWFPEWDFGGQPWNSELYNKWSPSNFVENYKTPCLVITGERDYRVPYTQSLHFFTDLQKMGVPSRLIVFQEDGHWPDFVDSMPFYYNAHLDWFHRYLGGEPAPYDMTRMLRNRHYEN